MNTCESPDEKPKEDLANVTTSVLEECPIVGT